MIIKLWMFFISFLSVFVSSYMVASVFQSKNERYKNTSFLVLLITMFAQVVLTFEILSLFKAINTIGVLVLNFLFLAISFLVFVRKHAKLYKPEPLKFLGKIWKGLKKDKFLLIIGFGLLFFIFVTILYNIFLPITSYDALSYHLNRSAFWLSQGSLAHFDITDDRNLVMPINSEILYLWVLTFLKNDIGLQFVSFIGYIMCAFSLYNILGYFGYCERKKLWSVFVLSSFASVIVEASSLETDVLIAGLILASVYLYLVALKEKTMPMMFFSALAYALAMGTKSPAIIAFPGVFLVMLFFAYRQNKSDFLRPIGIFLGFLVLNFVVFSSYNYILNYLDYQNFLGSESARTIHGFRGGGKAFVANFIRYIFMMFDFSGFSYSKYLGEYITTAKLAIFDFLHIPHMLGVEMPDNNVVNNLLLEVKMGTGLLGFLLFLPATILSIFIGIKSLIKKSVSRKKDMLFAFGLLFFMSICSLSFSIAYMVFSVRFVTTMVIISTPVLVLSYIKRANLFKFVLLFFIMSYFFVMTLHIVNRPAKLLLNVFIEEKSIQSARERIRCSVYKDMTGKNSFCYLRDIMRTKPVGTKYAILADMKSKFYIIKMLEHEGYGIEALLPEKLDSYDLSKYDYLIKTDEPLKSDVLLNDTKHTKIDYKIDAKDGSVHLSKDKFGCVYLKQNSYGAYNTYDFAKDNDKGNIVASICFINDSYFEAKGYEKERSYNFFKVDSPIESNYMTIYKNIKK